MSETFDPQSTQPLHTVGMTLHPPFYIPRMKKNGMSTQISEVSVLAGLFTGHDPNRPSDRMRRFLNSRGSSRVGPGEITGRVGSGRVTRFFNITGQGQVMSGRDTLTGPDPRQK